MENGEGRGMRKGFKGKSENPRLIRNYPKLSLFVILDLFRNLLPSQSLQFLTLWVRNMRFLVEVV